MSFFVENLKTLRKEQKLTQGKAAEKLNISLSTYIAYEKGEREPSLGIFIAICSLFNITLDDMVKGRVVIEVLQKRNIKS